LARLVCLFLSSYAIFIVSTLVLSGAVTGYINLKRPCMVFFVSGKARLVGEVSLYFSQGYVEQRRPVGLIKSGFRHKLDGEVLGIVGRGCMKAIDGRNETSWMMTYRGRRSWPFTWRITPFVLCCECEVLQIVVRSLAVSVSSTKPSKLSMPIPSFSKGNATSQPSQVAEARGLVPNGPTALRA
jgi:hypothetical protein